MNGPAASAGGFARPAPDARLVPRPVYPAALESWWLAEAGRATGRADPEEALDALAPDIEALSDAFTVDRAPGFGGYARDDRRLAAYGVFFFPQTWARAAFAMREAAAFRGRPAAPPAAGPWRVLDLGAGTGAAGFAALDALSGAGRGAELVSADRSGESLQYAARLFADRREALWPRASHRTAAADLAGAPELGRSWDLVIVSFALNERFESRPDADLHGWAAAWLRRLAPGGVLAIVEPGTRDAARRLQRLRDRVAAAGEGEILGPCLHAGACPMRPREDLWCHEVRRWQPPPGLAWVNRRLHRSTGELRFSFLLLGPASGATAAAAPGDGRRARLVAPIREQKGLLTTFGCAGDGLLHAYERRTRGLGRAGIKRAMEVERGDVLEWEAPAPAAEAGRARRVDSLERRAFGFAP